MITEQIGNKTTKFERISEYLAYLDYKKEKKIEIIVEHKPRRDIELEIDTKKARKKKPQKVKFTTPAEFLPKKRKTVRSDKGKTHNWKKKR